MKTTTYEDVIAHTDFDNLLLLAQKRLELLLQKDANNTKILKQLIDVYRKRGLLHKAQSKSQHLNQLNPTKYDKYLYEILFQKDISVNGWDTKAAPFVVIDDFLSEKEQQIIWNVINQNQSKFETSQITKKGIDKNIRDSKVLYKKNLKEISSFFLPNVYASLEQNYKHLSLSPFEPIKKEIQLTLHTDGHFFTVHKDSGAIETTNRTITFVYYFHKLPKAYKGGDLLLFDTNEKEDIHTKDYTRIITRNNMLILFPSFYYHQVTPVLQDTDDWIKGRFTLNGWFHKS